MANYINREVLCEAYTHLDIQTYSKQEDREKLEAELKDFIQPRAKFMFGDDVEVNIEFNEGSLITTIQIVGFVAQLISGYKDFTTGIDELTKDAVSFAQSTNSEVVFKTKTQNCNRVRLEKRTGVLGRINKLIHRIRPIHMTANYNEPVYNERTLHKINKNTIILDEWYSDVVKLIEKLESKESETCVAAGFLEEINKLPESLPWAQLLTQDSFISQIQNQDITLTSKINAEAARYRTVLNSIKIDLKRIMETQEQKNTQVVNSNL